VSVTKNPGRQAPITAYADVVLADLVPALVTKSVSIAYSDLTSGVAFDAIALPVGAVVVSGNVAITTAFNSATSDVLVVGDVTTANRYLGSTTIHTGAATPIALVPTAFVVTGTQPNLQVKWTGVGSAPSAGLLVVTVTYYVAADLAVIDLPHDAIVLSGRINVTQAFNSGGGDHVTLGDSASSARYLGLTDVSATGLTAITPTGYINANATPLTLRWLYTGAVATTGKLRVAVKYYRHERAQFSQD
jgi:hypothetical protein